MCLSEIFLDSAVSNNDENIVMNSYSILRTDYPNNIKWKGACVQFIARIRKNAF